MDSIRTSYVDVFFPDGCVERTVMGIYQYDHGLKLRQSGITTPKTISAQFAYLGLKNTLSSIVKTENGYHVCEIPDIVLSQTKEVRCYIYIEDSESGVTIKEIRMPITPRAKPSDISMTPQQVESYNAIVSQLNDLIEDVTSVKSDLTEAKDSANLAAKNADQSADKAEKASKKLSGVSLTVEMLPPSSNPTSKVTQTDTSTNFQLGIPASNLAYATFDVNSSDGCLYMYTPEGFDDIDFQISSAGDLLVVV